MDEKLELQKVRSMLMEHKEKVCTLTKDKIDEMVNGIKEKRG